MPSERYNQLAQEARFYTARRTNVLRVAIELDSSRQANIFLIASDYNTSGLTISNATRTKVFAAPQNADNRRVRITIGTATNVSAK